MPHPTSWLLFLLLVAAAPVFGQTDTTGEMQNLYFVGRGRSFVPRSNDYVPDARGFYLYRNAEYMLVLQDGVSVTCRLRDIRHDSLVLAIYDINDNESGRRVISPGEIREMRFGSTSIWHLYKLSMSDYEPVFERTATPKEFDWPISTSISRDSSWTIEHIPIPLVTQTGLDTLHQRHRVFRYTPYKDTGRIRRGVWFTPSGAYEIKGVNIGLISDNASMNHPQIISGVNLNVDVVSGFMTIYLPIIAVMSLVGDREVRHATVKTSSPPPDSLNKKSNQIEPRFQNGNHDLIRGVSISAGGVVGPGDVHGFSLNGGLCMVSNFRGVLITGVLNVNESFRGVEISAVGNSSSVGRGVQLGVVNSAKNFKGIQIGLWNVNSKRSLPFVNWDF